MSKSNIALAVLAGAVIGGAVALILKAQSELDEAVSPEEAADEEEESPEFETIAKQFSERISSELKAAEEKLKSAAKRSDLIIPDGEFGVFL